MADAQAKILVIRGGAIGDFILTLPVLAALRRQFPQVRLEVLGYPHIVQLAILGGLAEAVRSIEAQALAGFFVPNGRLAPELMDYFAGFAIILSYLYDPDGIFRSNVARCSQAQFIVGPHRPSENEGVPASQVFLRPLERLAIFEADTVPQLHLQRPTRSNLRREPRRLAVHPGSGSGKKNWPEPHWQDLLSQIVSQTDWQVLLMGGEAEGDRLERLAALLPPARLERARSLPLVQLAERLLGYDFFIGHDSGISHLAAAVGLPGMVLWGESVEEVWRPPSRQVSVVRDARGLAAIGVERVLQQLREGLNPAGVCKPATQ